MKYEFEIPKYIYGVDKNDISTELYRMQLFDEYKNTIINTIEKNIFKSPPSKKERSHVRKKVHQYFSQLIMSIITNRTYSSVWRKEVILEDGLFNTPTLDETSQFYIDINNILRSYNVQYKNDQFNIINSFKYIIEKLQQHNPHPVEFSCEVTDKVCYNVGHLKLTMSKVIYDKCVKSHKGENYQRDILCCLLRYKTLNSGANQFVVDLSYKDELKKYGFNFECFASVFNRYYDNYCSMFYDLEKHFGSCGSFMALKIKAGYYMANPPYDENLLDKMYTCVTRALHDSNVVILMSIPLWDNYELETRIDAEHLYKKRQVREEQFHTDMDPSIMVLIPKYINYLFYNTSDDINNFLKFYDTKKIQHGSSESLCIVC